MPATGILEVSNAALPLPFTQVTATTFASSGQGSLFVGRKARGTAAAPSAVQNGDVLAGVLGRGYGATNFNGTGNGGMFVRAAETWTDTAQGTSINFNTTTTGTTMPATRMTLASDRQRRHRDDGAVGSPGYGEGNARPLRTISLTRYAGASSSGEPNIVLRTARGTRAAPSRRAGW